MIRGSSSKMILVDSQPTRKSAPTSFHQIDSVLWMGFTCNTGSGQQRLCLILLLNSVRNRMSLACAWLEIKPVERPCESALGVPSSRGPHKLAARCA